MPRRAWTLLAFSILVLVPSALVAQEKGAKTVTGPLQFQAEDIEGRKVDLSKYRGKVVLFVNVASECGYTKQYKGLQELHDQYAAKGLAILGFPCNDFGSQEPGTEAQIKEFAEQKYNVTFDLFSKVRVVGKDASPIYQNLTGRNANTKTGDVAWNFEKFLIGRDGQLVARFASDVTPESPDFRAALERELNKK